MKARIVRMIRDDLLANGASTTAQIATRLKKQEVPQIRQACHRLTKSRGQVTASGPLENPATTYTWTG